MNRSRVLVPASLLLIGIGVGLGVSHAGADTHEAADPDITVPIDTVIRGPVGSVHLTAEQPTPAELVGATCTGTVVVVNQGSEHPNSDLIISSGSSSATVLDVESEAFATRVTLFELTLGPTVTVHVRLGADAVFSGGFEVLITCPETPATTIPGETTTIPSETTTTVADTTTTTIAATTTTVAATTTAAPTTTAAATTTSAPPGVGGPVPPGQSPVPSFPSDATLPATR